MTFVDGYRVRKVKLIKIGKGIFNELVLIKHDIHTLVADGNTLYNSHITVENSHTVLAVTRARDMVVLVGSEKTIQNMTMNNQFHQRFTGLTEKLVAVKKFVAEKEENS